MCTITYIPTSDGFIATQNRDESPLRSEALFPLTREVNHQKIWFPKDPDGLGSWFVSSKTMTVGIMNGAYHPDKKEGDYRHSRGLIPIHFFDYKGPKEFTQLYPFKGLEAFTMVIMANTGVHVVDWDEEKLHFSEYSRAPLIFQSKPLYPSPQNQMRQKLFEDFIQTKPDTEIIDFHKLKFKTQPEMDICIDRQVVKTVSISQRTLSHQSNTLLYAPTKTLFVPKTIEF